MRVPFSAGFFRLLLAGLVVAGHMSRFHLGHLAVNVFFVWSGYWIARMREWPLSPTPVALT